MFTIVILSALFARFLTKIFITACSFFSFNHLMDVIRDLVTQLLQAAGAARQPALAPDPVQHQVQPAPARRNRRRNNNVYKATRKTKRTVTVTTFEEIAINDPQQ